MGASSRDTQHSPALRLQLSVHSPLRHGGAATARCALTMRDGSSFIRQGCKESAASSAGTAANSCTGIVGRAPTATEPSSRLSRFLYLEKNPPQLENQTQFAVQKEKHPNT